MKNVIKTIVAGLVALIIFSAISIVYNYTGTHITSKTGATDYTWESGQFITNMNEGFAIIHMDPEGFNNVLDVYEVKNDISTLLMGSSHMEAVQMGMKENVGYLLNEMLPDETTYNIGISGHDINIVFSNLDTALEYYRPSERVVIEISDLTPSVDTMQKVMRGELADIPSYDTGLVYAMSVYMPGIKRLFLDLKQWASVSIESLKTSNSISNDGVIVEDLPVEYRETLDSYLARVADIAAKHDVELMLFYHPTLNIDQNGRLVGFNENVDLFGSLCADNGIIFIDMTQDFVDLYENSNQLAHGFINSELGVGHLNKYGHRVCAERIAETIREAR